MTINIVDVVGYKYPGQILKGNVSFRQVSPNEIEIVTWSVPNEPQPSEQELEDFGIANEQAITLNKLFNDAAPQIQVLIDETARLKQYGDGYACASYVASTNPTWQAQALAFVAWRDSVWMYSYTEFQKMAQGQRPTPTIDEFLTELPTIVWPN